MREKNQKKNLTRNRRLGMFDEYIMNVTLGWEQNSIKACIWTFTSLSRTKQKKVSSLWFNGMIIFDVLSQVVWYCDAFSNGFNSSLFYFETHKIMVPELLFSHLVFCLFLKDPSDKRRIICDDKLKELFGVDSFTGFTVSKLLTTHFIKTEQWVAYMYIIRAQEGIFARVIIYCPSLVVVFF